MHVHRTAGVEDFKPTLYVLAVGGQRVQERPHAYVFLSTHGYVSNHELFLISYDVNFQDDISIRHTAVRYTDLRETLTRLADRGKTIVFLDACHSGNVNPATKGGERAKESGSFN